MLVVDLAVNLVWLTSANGLADLGSFLHSGVAFRHGLDPYGFYAWLNPPPISRDALNLNPPVTVYFFAALTLLSAHVVQSLFLGASVALFAVAVALLLREYPDKRDLLVVLAVLSMAGVWHMLWYRQIYAPLLLAIVGSWLLMRRGRLVWAGVLIGLVIVVKPNYALLPLLLFAAGHRRVAIPAFLTAAVVSAIPLAVDGPSIYEHWIRYSMAFQGIDWASNASLMSVGDRFGSAGVGEALTALLVVAAVVWHWRARPALLDATAAGLLAVILLGPVSWAGYTLLLLPFLFSRRWDRWTWVAILLLDIPYSWNAITITAGYLTPLGDAASAFGGLLSSNGAVRAVSDSSTFGPVFDEALYIGHALLGCVYAAAVLLLLGRHLRQTPTAATMRVPRPTNWSEIRRLVVRPADKLRAAEPGYAIERKTLSSLPVSDLD